MTPGSNQAEITAAFVANIALSLYVQIHSLTF